MKIIHKDLKHGTIKVKTENNEDVWYLGSIIEEGDSISGMTERKIKIGGSEEKSKISKRVVFLKIRVEKTDSDGSSLRVSGPIVEAPDDIPKGDFHTFPIENDSILTIEKESWSRYALKKLEEATEENDVSILIVAFDREEALFARLKKNGHEELLHLKGDVSKKDYEEKKSNFYQEIVHHIQDYDKKYGFNNIVVASPAFWKEYLMKEIKDDSLKKKIVLATCSSIDGTTISELLKRPELKTVLERDRSAREAKLLDALLANIQKENASYGFKEVSEKLQSGNLSTLLVSENLIKKLRTEKTFQKLDNLMHDAESLNAEIIIVSSEEPAKQLDGLSGIACLLRWKENY
jgi:protein pelota